LLAQIIPGLGGGDAAGDAPAIHGHGGAVHPAAIPDRTAVLPYSDPRATARPTRCAGRNASLAASATYSMYV
jgi:hypothetical protein